MAVYRGALGQNDLERRCGAKAALRLARLAEGRGDAAVCRDYLNQAVRLNDVNVGGTARPGAAWRPPRRRDRRRLPGMCRLDGAVRGQSVSAGCVAPGGANLPGGQRA